MKTSWALLLLCIAVVASASCGNSGGSSGVSAQAGEAAYEKAYAQAWVNACKKAVADIHRRDSSRRLGRVACRQPQGQQEGNLAFDPKVARQQGLEEGSFDGCAYAWDEAYATSGADVQPRC
ncbi:MAG TPA: hypothetical protein VNB86_00110 [Gaiellaceae bacterium]|nr:hypothetical protein [Gaiellaceae bacterium]